MLITIKTANHIWTSPDGQVKIWDFTGAYADSGESMQGQTRSQKIATSTDQTLDLTTTVSKSGKTYYVQVPREGGGWSSPSTTGAPSYQATQGPLDLKTSDHTAESQNASERFYAAVERFDKAVDKLVGKDKLPTDEQVQKVAEYFGGEIVDDL